LTTAIAKLTDKQNAFLQALQSEDLVDVPKRERLRWCARKAGYEDNTTIAHITGPMQDEIVRVLERKLTRLAFDATMALDDALNGDIVPLETKIRVDVARDILDRVIPKKEAKQANQAPLVQIILPGKVPTKEIEIIDG